METYSFSGLDKLRAQWRACMQGACKELFACMKLCAHKSVKILLTSTPTLFKEVSYFFLSLKTINIWHNKI